MCSENKKLIYLHTYVHFFVYIVCFNNFFKKRDILKTQKKFIIYNPILQNMFHHMVLELLAVTQRKTLSDDYWLSLIPSTMSKTHDIQKRQKSLSAGLPGPAAHVWPLCRPFSCLQSEKSTEQHQPCSLDF